MAHHRCGTPIAPSPAAVAPLRGSLTPPPSSIRCVVSVLRLRRNAVPVRVSFTPSAILPAPVFVPRWLLCYDVGAVRASTSGVTPSSEGDEVIEIIEGSKEESTSTISKLAIALGIAAAITIVSISAKFYSSGTSLQLPLVIDSSSQSITSAPYNGFTLTLFGYQVIIPERTPGWIYFWLLMAAGCGLFISEEALNVWVGISLARSLCLDGNWQSFSASFARNSSYIISTVLWVYWGVCISDMIPFYLGRLFSRTKASKDFCGKLGIGKEKALRITRVIQKYGNLIGFVERFSLGVRNPTAFLAGAWDIPAEFFFTGVCFGGVITLLIQDILNMLNVHLYVWLMSAWNWIFTWERPIVALAGVATFVGIWTIFPYLLATLTTLFILLRQPLSD